MVTKCIFMLLMLKGKPCATMDMWIICCKYVNRIFEGTPPPTGVLEVFAYSSRVFLVAGFIISPSNILLELYDCVKPRCPSTSWWGNLKIGPFLWNLRQVSESSPNLQVTVFHFCALAEIWTVFYLILLFLFCCKMVDWTKCPKRKEDKFFGHVTGWLMVLVWNVYLIPN